MTIEESVFRGFLLGYGIAILICVVLVMGAMFVEFGVWSFALGALRLVLGKFYKIFGIKF